jgi:ADP-ribosylation factor-like protein 6
MDIPGAMTEEECSEELDLCDIRDKPWHIVSSNALSGDGIEHGIEWMCDHVNTRSRK